MYNLYMSLVTHLKNIGLGDKAAKVYLAMLELGPASVLEIAAKASVNRPTTYLQIEELKKKGLVSTQMKGKKDLYIAESPDQLEKVLEQESKDLEIKMNELKKALPELASVFNLAGDKPVVRYFEGKEGLLRMQEEFLKCKSKQILAIANFDNVMDLFPNQKSDYTERRVKAGIESKAIYTSKRGNIVEYGPSVLRELRYIPFDKFSFDADITIYDNIVAIASLRGQIGGLLVEHQGIAESFKSLFNFIWKLSEKT